MAITTFVASQILTAAQMNAVQGNDYNQTVSTKTASYTLVAADKGTRIVMNVASANTVTVNTSLFSAGDTLIIQNIGAGVSTVTAGTATVSSAGPLAIPQNGSGLLYFTSAGVSIFYPSAVNTAPSTSRIWLHTFTSYGTSSTKIPRFTTTVVNSGSDITYADSASLGSTFTINTAGMYAVSCEFAGPPNQPGVSGISLNSTQLTTDIESISAATRLAAAYVGVITGDATLQTVSSIFYFAVNDVIRPHTSGLTPNVAARAAFQIVRLN